MKMFYGIAIFICLVVQSQENYHRQSKSKEAQMGPQLSPLGILGASGLFQVGRADIRIQHVEGNSIAELGGLKSGDVIVSANGENFPKATNNVDDGGKGPRESLGNAIEKSLGSQNKVLKLDVSRNGSQVALTLKLPNLITFSSNYPYKCQRSSKMLKDICEYLITQQKPDGSWRKYVLTSTAGLALLGSGDKKYKSAVKKAAYSIIDKDLAKGELPIWNFIYSGTFLCEYYLASGDSKVLKTINYINDTLALKATSENGRHAHEITDEPGYKGGGLNIVTAHVYLFWTLAKKCGIKIHQKQYDAVLKHLTISTRADGGTGYMRQATNVRDGSARTGLFALGLYLSGDNNELMNIQGKYLGKHYKRMREAHANGLFGMIWGSAALACINQKGFREHMDYWKWYMNMGETPQGHKLVRYYIGSKRNNGGDGYLNWDNFNHATIGMFLVTGTKNLFIHGGQKRNWF